MSRILTLAAAVVAGLSGCASPARFVEQGPDHGVVAIPANTNAWPYYYQREAQALIERHVGPDFEVVDQRAVPVGTLTSNNQQVKREQAFTNPFTGPVEKDTVTSTTSTHDITEWRITYRKRSGAVGTTTGAVPAAGTVRTQYQSGVQPAGGVVPNVAPAGAAASPLSGLTSQAASCPDCAPKVGGTVQADAGVSAMPKR